MLIQASKTYAAERSYKLVNLHALIGLAKGEGASDLHLEPGLPAVIRVRGSLRSVGEPAPAPALLDCARELIGAGGLAALSQPALLRHVADD